MPARDAIYLDGNAGAFLHPRVAEKLLSLFHQDGPGLIPNPSSIHSQGRRAKRLVSTAREQIALSLGRTPGRLPRSLVDPEQLVFTSSGTEANQLAIRSTLGPRLTRGEACHWILSPVEHDSVLQMAEWVSASGGAVDYLPVDAQGRPRADALARLVRPETALISVVWANNETGVITDLAPFAEFARARGIPLHIDAAQAWGKLEIDVAKTGASFVSLSAHKIGGLAGTGVLWVKPGNPVDATLRGKQEKGRRAGTENVVGIVAAGTAAEQLDPVAWAAAIEPVRDRLEREICSRIGGVLVNGLNAPRIANTLNIGFDGVEGESLVLALDLEGYCVSSGSACSSGVIEPSHVLMAMGRSRGLAMAALRISLPAVMPWEKLEGFVSVLEKTVARVRAAPAAYRGPEAKIETKTEYPAL